MEEEPPHPCKSKETRLFRLFCLLVFFTCLYVYAAHLPVDHSRYLGLLDGRYP